MLSVYEAQETLLEDDRIMLLLKRQMNDASERLEFEKAQQIKTKLDLLIRMQEEQIVDRHVSYHQDVVYFGRERALIAKVEFGKIRSALSMYDLDPELSYDNACRQLLMQLYSTDSPAK